MGIPPWLPRQCPPPGDCSNYFSACYAACGTIPTQLLGKTFTVSWAAEMIRKRLGNQPKDSLANDEEEDYYLGTGIGSTQGGCVSRKLRGRPRAGFSDSSPRPEGMVC